MFLYRDLSLINAWRYRSDVNVNSLGLRCRELIYKTFTSGLGLDAMSLTLPTVVQLVVSF